MVTFQLISAGWRTGTLVRYERAWVKFEEFLVAEGVPLDSVTVNNSHDSLAHLVVKLGLSRNTVGVHRSAISQTLSLFDGDSFADHN